MNWVDIAVIVIIGICALVGFARGLIRSVFKVVSFFIAGFGAMIFYPLLSQKLVADYQMDKVIGAVVSTNLTKILGSEQIKQAAVQQIEKSTGVSELVSSWHLPKAVETMVNKNITAQASQISGNIAETVADSMSRSLAMTAVNIISMIAIFVFISILLFVVRLMLDGIASLPVLNLVNHAGGIVFGAVEGILIVYIVFAILTIFAATQSMEGLFSAINSSSIAKGFYNNNLLLIWAFGGK